MARQLLETTVIHALATLETPPQPLATLVTPPSMEYVHASLSVSGPGPSLQLGSRRLRMMIIDDDNSEFTSAPARKSRLGAPQLQAQLSRLSDRTRLRRLQNTLYSEGAWQQVTRIEDLRHTHVSRKWLYHVDACAGSVLTPHDHITNVQKRLSNRTLTGFGQCRLCGSFLDPCLEHGEICSPTRPLGDITQAFAPSQVD